MPNLIQRQANQSARIAYGVANGTLTRPEAVALGQQLQATHQQIRQSRQPEGPMSRDQWISHQRTLNQASRQIWGATHNNVYRP